jgi:tetratricopeptide (TPR) repeat protein
MKINLTLTIILSFLFGILNAQTVEELYNKQDFKELIKFADKTEELTKDQLYCVGYAFFQLKNDTKAIELYDKAIAKGLDDDHIYLCKGLSLRYEKQYDKAIEIFKTAINRNPKGQKNHTELANTFYYQKKNDSALVYFYKARKLKFELGTPYLKVPDIYHVRQDFKKALEEYYISASLINKEDPIYIEILKSIGLLEYTVTKNYRKSIKAYSEVVSILPKDYNNYPKLIKAYYANEDFIKGDGLISIMKAQYEKGALPEEYQEYGSVAIDEFEWKGQKVTTYKYFKKRKETLDIIYKIYLLSKDGKSVERTLMTEKTIQTREDGAKHLLCEREKSGVHHTYPSVWSTDKIDYVSLKKSVILVLNKEMNPSYSSSFGAKSKDKKRQKI